MKAKGFFSWVMALNVAASLLGTAGAAGDSAAGRQKFQSCLQCHGKVPGANVNTQGPVPKLGGQHAEYIVSALNDYAGGGRIHAGMKSIAGALGKQDKEDIAAFIAQFELKTLSVPEGGAPTAIERKIENCRSCHGERGNSFTPYNPRLIGQDEKYLLKSLKDYKNGLRKNPTMVYVVKKLTDQELAEMAAYYSAQNDGLTEIE
ncbi:MAG: c-type cytochrome [Pseudomonadota bacterium]